MRAIQNVRNLRRRVTGKMDTSAFTPPRFAIPPAPYSSELSRLSLYRLGLSGTFGKYRVVPRSGIVGHDVLAAKVRDDDGAGSLRRLIETLWRDHGAPSRAVLDRFLAQADQVDRRAGTTPAGETASARRQLLDQWLKACAPRSAAGRAYDTVELAICFLMRRAKLYAHALVRKVRS